MYRLRLSLSAGSSAAPGSGWSDSWRKQRRSARIALTVEERDSFLQTQQTCRVATASLDGRPHVSALWFVWLYQSIWLYSIIRAQRWTDLQRNARCAIIVDDGIDYSELRGVELYGSVSVVGETPRVGLANEELRPIEQAFGHKYGGSHPIYDSRHGWLRLRPEREFTWDFRKLAP